MMRIGKHLNFAPQTCQKRKVEQTLPANLWWKPSLGTMPSKPLMGALPSTAIYADCFFHITSAMPPKIATDESVRRSVIDSPRKITPPSAAMAGTLNCTVAALVALRPRIAVYQTE